MNRIADLLRASLDPRPREPDPAAGMPAAVMVPVLDLARPALLFTVRSHQVRDHKGEISFPGGVRQPDDADLLATALRETKEELGIAPADFEVLGALPPTQTVVSGYVIQPFVGLLPGRPEIVPSPLEIAQVLELDVARLAAVEREVNLEDRPGVMGAWFAYTVDGHTVWGATGRIVHGFLEALRERGWEEE